MLFSLGPLAFEVAPLNMTEFNFSGDASFASKDVIGRSPVLEFMGEGQATMDIVAVLFPEKLGGLEMVDDLYDMRVSGDPHFLMRGDGVPLGWFVITSVYERATYLDAKGVPRKLELDISLSRTDGPEDPDFPAVAS